MSYYPNFFKSLPGYLMGTAGETGFSSGSKAADIAAKHGETIKGRVYIVTGANCGLGKETTRVLSDQGGHVIMACRSQERMDEARKDLMEQNKDAKIDTLLLDLSSLKSIEAAAKEFLKRDLPLHCLINNAAVMLCPASKTEDGAELQFGTNVLGHHHLITQLLPKLKATGTPSEPSRIVNLASAAHSRCYPEGIRFKNLGVEDYSAMGSYGQSKLGNILYTRALADRLKAEGANVFTACCHPGVIPTELSRHMPAAARKVFFTVAKPVLKSIPQGSATTTLLATAPTNSLVAGKYYADCNPCFTTPFGVNDEMAKKLYDILPGMVEDPTRVDWS